MWRHIAQSVQGLRHRAGGVPCQDRCLVRVFGEGTNATLLACVADGAGVAEHGGVGADLACQAMLQSAATYLATRRSFAGLKADQVRRWCEAARTMIGNFADSKQHSVKEYATTLCVAIVSAEGSAFFQIGDGAIIARRGEAFGVVFWPQSGEYVNTTNFLTSKDFHEHIQVLTAPGGFSDVALMTDGIERLALKFDTFTPHLPFFQPLFGALREAPDVERLGEELRQLLQSDSVRDKTDDDKTLVLASRVSHDVGGAH